MINFNVPPYVGKELEYIKQAVEEDRKICGDGKFTKICNKFMEEKFNAKKVLLTFQCNLYLHNLKVL